MAPKVTVVIPCYNARRTIVAAIHSVLRQTVQDFEVLVVDDASQDDTARIAAETCGDRGRVIRHERNRGPSTARNTAFEAAKGEWIATLDADDFLAPNYIEVMLSHAAEHSSAFFGCDVAVFFGEIETPVSFRSMFSKLRIPFHEGVSSPGLADFLRLCIDIKPFFPTEIVRSHGIRQSGQGSEWLEFIAELYRCGLQLVLVDRPLYFYRVHDANYSSRYAQIHEDLTACERLLVAGWLSDEAREIVRERRDDLRRHRPWKALHRGMLWQALLGFLSAPQSIPHGLALAKDELAKRTFRKKRLLQPDETIYKY